MLVLRGLQLTRIVRKLSGRYRYAVPSSHLINQLDVIVIEPTTIFSPRQRLLSVNCVRTTNNLPSIVVIEKIAEDEVRSAVKMQLGYLAQFVNVSSEMYQAVHYEKIDEKTL